ncbi:hypothetical protein [Cyclobacterium jeungdonense]|uniref:Uncharacterized protein n=1 Tax=Cyclobacterium jeungdonense TaxID=708087 RepID=A0ABT8C640_9BACT|nr:hypothetical protein [Cyclobacterium jeungdonense]MDN3688254.1 hypothetical protein [Cyclobacterium jeungdonense]
MGEIQKDHIAGCYGKKYLVFEVTSLKEPEQCGKTHAAYISKNVVAPKGGGVKKSKP